MRDAREIANLFIDLANENEDSITNSSLNKLLYLAQGWSLALLDRPLFSDEIEAWEFGPVIPAIYSDNPIEKADQSYMEVPFDVAELELILDVYEAYKKGDGEFVDGERFVVPKETIKAHFEKQIAEHPLHRRSIRLSPRKAITKRNPKTGRIVLPKEWAD